MEENERTLEVKFEAEIIERMNDLIASKKAENEFAIGRLGTMETAWPEINKALDEEITAELDVLADEAEAMAEARKRLERNICSGVDKRTWAIAGKVSGSGVGLPGLGVKMALSESDSNGYIAEDTTNSYGDFNLEMVVKDLDIEEGQSTKFRFDILVSLDEVVHIAEVEFKPKRGKTDLVRFAVECTGKLKDHKDYGKRVKESIESDADLLAARTQNMKTAYTAYGSLTKTTLALIKDLKADLAVSPPRIAPPARVSVTEATEETRFLGNSNSRELHDLQNETRNCRISEISPDRRVSFTTTEEAVALGYDFCAYCFGKNRSKR